MPDCSMQVSLLVELNVMSLVADTLHYLAEHMLAGQPAQHGCGAGLADVMIGCHMVDCSSLLMHMAVLKSRCGLMAGMTYSAALTGGRGHITECSDMLVQRAVLKSIGWMKAAAPSYVASGQVKGPMCEEYSS